MKKLLTVVIALLLAQAAWSQGQDPPATVEEMTRDIWQATNEIRELLLDLAAPSLDEALLDVALTFTSATEGTYASTYLEYGRESTTGSGTFEFVGVVETDPPGEISADTISAANDGAGEDDDEGENPKE